MIFFLIYALFLGWAIYYFCKKYDLDFKIVFWVWLFKVIFIFLISYSDLRKCSFLNVPDEDNYFHDALMFYSLAKEDLFYYFKILLDIEPEKVEIYNKYFTTTNAWFKAPEFFYNDNRWVVKVHSLFVFLSNGELSVHRLFSGFISIIGGLILFGYFNEIIERIFEKQFHENIKQRISVVFVVSQLFPAYFFYTSFVLKESLLLFLLALILLFIKRFFEEKLNWKVLIIILMLILIGITFRPVYIIPTVCFSILFWIVIRYINNKHRFLAFIVLCFIILLFFSSIFKIVFNKNILELAQYRQERFLDASRGGIFLVNDKKFVRVPYDWNNVRIDSLNGISVVRIKKNVPLMYWYLVNFNDTIFEINRDSIEEYKLVYFIEKANRTVYIPTLNKNASIFQNIHSIVEALKVFFFYPRDIEGILDIVVWFENIILLLLFFAVTILMIKDKRYSYYAYLLIWLGSIILIIAVTSPNTGAIVRYRYFILPILFINFALHSIIKGKENAFKN
ncbi:MAG: hypothetical protein KatS3mg027_1405 [Bacteroidia bacterium]|nr:MAG: hypothetical protein KatS3mg027_1405 [Bacteroidia bacterium]